MSNQNGTMDAAQEAPPEPQQATPEQIAGAQQALVSKAYAKIGELSVVNDLLQERLSRCEQEIAGLRMQVAASAEPVAADETDGE